MFSNEEKLARASRVKALLSDELMTEAFNAVENEYIAHWKDSPARDTEGRERLWLMLRLLHRIRGHLLEVVDEGKLAAKSLSDKDIKRVI